MKYGARANEQALRYQLQNIAVYAAVTTNANNPNSKAQVNALQQRISANQIEGINQDEVATKILALQTSLQASYQTTSMLYQTTLTKYLPI